VSSLVNTIAAVAAALSRLEVANIGLRVPGASALVNTRLRLPPPVTAEATYARDSEAATAGDARRQRGTCVSPRANLPPSAVCARRAAGGRGLTCRRAAYRASDDTIGGS